MQNIISTIKQEIKLFIPANDFADDKEALTVRWSDIEAGEIKIFVKCHLNHSPDSDEFLISREQILVAVGRAAQLTKVQFA